MMDILNNLNSRVALERTGETLSQEQLITALSGKLSFDLPNDFIDLLNKSDTGYHFRLDDKDFCIWGARTCLEEHEDDEFINEFLPNSLIIGSDMGDWVIFYGNGVDGFGVYVVEDGSLGYEQSTKIADSLTDILVHGLGIDAYVNYM